MLRKPTVEILATLLFALVQPAFGAEQTAVLKVPLSSLVFDGPGLNPPDQEGHFAIGIRLPQHSVRADRCETPNLIIGIGTLNKPLAELNRTDKKIIENNKKYYDKLVVSSKGSGTIAIPVRNSSRYLLITDGVISAPYCTLSIDERKVP